MKSIIMNIRNKLNKKSYYRKLLFVVVVFNQQVIFSVTFNFESANANDRHGEFSKNRKNR